MGQASRWITNQNTINRDQKTLWNARAVLDRFRHFGDPSGFAALRQFLSDKSGKSFRTFSLEGWGPDRHNLTEKEYVQFKEAYKATEAGTLDDWKFWRNPDDTFW
jgi:hypothetical protein